MPMWWRNWLRKWKSSRRTAPHLPLNVEQLEDRIVPVVLNSLSAQASLEGSSIALATTASDPAGLPLTYDAVGLPLGLTINATSGTIYGVVDYQAANRGDGTYQPVVIVRNSLGDFASQTFPWSIANVNRSPVLNALANQGNTAGQMVALQPVASDPDGNPLYFGASGLPQGLTIDPVTGQISGTLDPSLPTGVYSVIVTASDLDLSASQSFSWSVTSHTLPSVTALSDRTKREGDSVSLQVIASDPLGAPLAYNAEGLPSGLSIDSTTGLITGSIAPGAASAGPWTVRVTASNDSYATSSSQSFAWTVTPYIIVGAIANQSVSEGNTVNLAVSANAPSGTLAFSADTLPDGLSLDATTGLISGTIVAGASQTKTFFTEVTVSNGLYATTQRFSWDVGRVGNTGPTLANPGSQTTPVGSQVLLALMASDAENDSLAFSATGLPHGLSIDSSTGHIIGYLESDDAVQAVPYIVTVTVDDGHGGSSSQTFSWTVTDAGFTGTGQAVAAVEGAPFANTLIATLTDPITARPASVYSAVIQWGDGLTSSGVVTADAGVVKVYGDHVYAHAGAYTIQVATSDPDGVTVTTSSTATVSFAGLTGLGATVAATSGETVSRTLAFFTDANPLDPASGYTATINWGDGTGSTSGQVTGMQGRLAVQGTHSYTTVGDYTAVITLLDPYGTTVQANASVSVGNAYAGRTSDFNVGTFTGSPPPGASAMILWGDGSSTPGTIVLTSGGYTVHGSHAYVSDGQYPAFASIMLNGGMVASSGTSLRISRPSITSFSAPVPAAADGTFNNVLLGAFIDPNANDSASSYQAPINWGDGTVSSGTIVGSSGYFRIFGSHLFAQAVLNPIAVQILWQTGALQTLFAQAPKAAPAAPAVRDSFMAALEKNFKVWAADGTTLKRADIDRLLEDPKIKGPDAAALAVLKAYVMDMAGDKGDELSANAHLFVKDIKDWTPDKGLTLENIRYYKGLQSDSSNKLYIEAANLETRFDEALIRMGKTSRTLFPAVRPPGEPNPSFTTVQQGMLGDCSFLAAVEASTSIFRTKFQERFKEIGPLNPGDPATYEVTFGNYLKNINVKKITVTAPTDAQIALYATAGAGGLWLSVMEKAYVKLVNADPTLTPLGNLNASAYEAVSLGQRLNVPMQILSGVEKVPVTRIADWTQNKLKNAILKTLQNKRSVTVQTPRLATPFRPAIDLPGGHAFAVVGINGTLLTLRNPWGDRTGSIRYGAEFKMELGDFVQKFSFIALEPAQ